MKDNVDLTIDRVFSSRTNNARLIDLFGRSIPRSFQRRKPWKKDISLYLDDPDYSGIDREHKSIPTGNKRERADHMMIYEEVYGHQTCARCGASIVVKPWMKIFHYDLCDKCDNELEKETIKEHRKPWT